MIPFNVVALTAFGACDERVRGGRGGWWGLRCDDKQEIKGGGGGSVVGGMKPRSSDDEVEERGVN